MMYLKEYLLEKNGNDQVTRILWESESKLLKAITTAPIFTSTFLLVSLLKLDLKTHM
jgi:hypothetical protein